MSTKHINRFKPQGKTVKLYLVSDEINMKVTFPYKVSDNDCTRPWYEPIVDLLKQVPSPQLDHREDISVDCNADKLHSSADQTDDRMEKKRVSSNNERNEELALSKNKNYKASDSRDEENILKTKIPHGAKLKRILKNSIITRNKTLSSIPRATRCRNKTNKYRNKETNIATYEKLSKGLPTGRVMTTKTPLGKYVAGKSAKEPSPSKKLESEVGENKSEKTKLSRVQTVVFERLTAGLPSGTKFNDPTHAKSVVTARKALDNAWDSVNIVYGSDQSGAIHKLFAKQKLE